MESGRTLDALAGHQLWIAGREFAPFRALGALGLLVGAMGTIAAALATGTPPWVVAGIGSACWLSFLGWAALRRLATSNERLVLLEHVWIAYAAVTVFALVADLAVRRTLDLASVGILPFLAIGRLGCFMAGCCYGAPASFGVCYRHDHTRRDLPDRLRGVRLFPVQLVEAAAIAAAWLVAIALLGGGPGATTVWTLIAYAAIRLVTESLRGDRRPRVAGVTVARWMATAQLVAGFALATRWTDVSTTPRTAATVAALALMSAVLGVVALARLRSPLTTVEHLDEVWNAIEQLRRDTVHRSAASANGRRAREPATIETSSGLRLVATRSREWLHVSMSHASLPTLPVARCLPAADIAHARGITHLALATEPGRAGEIHDPSLVDETDHDAADHAGHVEVIRSPTYFAPTVELS